MKLLHCLSLPQRLLFCVFNPVVLLFTLSLLLTIWSSYLTTEVCESTSTPSPSEVLSTTTALSVSTSTVTSTLTATYHINATRIRSIADAYVERRVDEINNTLLRRYGVQVEAWQHTLTSWNASFSGAIEQRRQDYLKLLAYNGTITNQLYGKSLQINNTWDFLANTALIAAEGVDGTQLFHNFTIDFWIASVLFSNISHELTLLEETLASSKVPSIGSIQSATPALPSNISKLFDVSISNFTDILEEQTSSPPTTAITERNVRSNSEDKSSLDRGPRYSIICLWVYLMSTFFLFIYELLTFRLETAMFNIHMAEILEAIVQQGSKTVALRQVFIRQTKALCFTLKKPLIYRIMNLIDSKSNGFEHIWKLRSDFFLWTFSNCKLTLILLFYTLVHWQITTSLTSSESSSVGLNYPRDIPSLDDQNGVYPPTITEIIGACINFTVSIDEIINESIFTQFEALLMYQIRKWNGEMKEFLQGITVITPPPWVEFNLTNPDGFAASYNASHEFIYTVMNNLVETSSIEKLGNQYLKRSAPQSSLSSNLGWNKIYRWVVLSIFLLFSLQNIIGFTIFLKV